MRPPERASHENTPRARRLLRRHRRHTARLRQPDHAKPSAPTVQSARTGLRRLRSSAPTHGRHKHAKRPADRFGQHHSQRQSTEGRSRLPEARAACDDARGWQLLAASSREGLQVSAAVGRRLQPSPPTGSDPGALPAVGDPWRTGRHARQWHVLADAQRRRLSLSPRRHMQPASTRARRLPDSGMKRKRPAANRSRKQGPRSLTKN